MFFDKIILLPNLGTNKLSISISKIIHGFNTRSVPISFNSKWRAGDPDSAKLTDYIYDL